MSRRFLDRLEADLAGLTRTGAHLDGGVGLVHRRVPALLRRGLTFIVLAVVLAASLASEFPATATGQPTPAALAAGHQLPRA